jgi:transcription antitermination factor NusG
MPRHKDSAMTDDFDRPWYALYVRSRSEKIVHAQLEAKQHDVFLPLYTGKHKWADRWKMVSLPLFPGYVFCRFDLANRSSVLATSGVIDLVRTGTEPAEIEPSEIEAVQAVVKSPLAAEPYPHLASGHRVMMSDGPLKGLSGTLMEIRDGLRLVISVELLCRSVLVEIDREWVIPCQPSQPPYPLGTRESRIA